MPIPSQRFTVSVIIVLLSLAALFGIIETFENRELQEENKALASELFSQKISNQKLRDYIDKLEVRIAGLEGITLYNKPHVGPHIFSSLFCLCLTVIFVYGVIDRVNRREDDGAT